jgi:hypothetical protein
MKKHVIAVTALIACMSIGNAGISFANSINLTVNGNTVDVQEAYVDDDTLMVPVRDIADAMGAETSWDDKNKAIEISLNGINADFSVGGSKVETLTKSMDLEKAVVIKNGSAYVPVTLFEYGLDAEVDFDKQSGKCTVATYDVNSKTGIKTVYNTISDSINSDDGTEILAYEIRYAQLDSDTDNSKAINETLKSEAEKTAVDFKNDYLQTQTEYYEDCKKDSTIPFRPATITSYVEIYSNDKYYSVLNTYSYDLGGAHPTSERESHVFKLNDGKEATAAECIGLASDDEVKETVLKGWKEKIASDKENLYFEDAANTLEEYYDEIGFYLNDKGVVFYMPLYSLVPYVGGFPEYEIANN